MPRINFTSFLLGVAAMFLFYMWAKPKGTNTDSPSKTKWESI